MRTLRYRQAGKEALIAGKGRVLFGDRALQKETWTLWNQPIRRNGFVPREVCADSLADY